MVVVDLIEQVSGRIRVLRLVIAPCVVHPSKLAADASHRQYVVLTRLWLIHVVRVHLVVKRSDGDVLFVVIVRELFLDRDIPLLHRLRAIVNTVLMQLVLSRLRSVMSLLFAVGVGHVTGRCLILNLLFLSFVALFFGLLFSRID